MVVATVATSITGLLVGRCCSYVLKAARVTTSHITFKIRGLRKMPIKCEKCGERVEALPIHKCRKGSNSASTDGSTAARIAKDRAIINLWNALRDLSDYGEEALTEQDLQLWGYVTGHDAVQSRLNKP